MSSARQFHILNIIHKVPLLSFCPNCSLALASLEDTTKLLMFYIFSATSTASYMIGNVLSLYAYDLKL